MEPTNITPNSNPVSLQNTMQTPPASPAAVISSDLATNVTDQNLQELAQREKTMKEQRIAADVLRNQQKAEAAKNPPTTEMSAVDKAILDSTGIAPPPPNPFKVQAENGVKNLTAQVENLSRDADPYVANLLGNIRDLYTSVVNEING